MGVEGGEPGAPAAPAPVPRRSAYRARHRARRARRSRLRRRLERSAISLGLVVVVIVGAAAGYGIYRNGQIQRVNVHGLSGHQRTENILLIGSTSRCVLDNKQTGAFGSCAQGVTGVNSDVVMVLHLDLSDDQAMLLSIPRDTFIPNARPGQSNRIDSALLYGPDQVVAAVEQDFGIPINHFVELNFDTFQNIVKALGGIKMYFPHPVKDADSGLYIPRAGCIELGAFQALAVVRARHMYYKVHHKWVYDGSGDLGRIIRVHEFLRVVVSSVAKRGLGNPLADNALLGAIAPDLTVDSSFGISEMVSLALKLHSINPNAVPEYTLPVIVDTSFDYEYMGADYGSIVFPSEPQDLKVIAPFTGQENAEKKVKPAAVTVAVVDGSGTGSAATTAARLAALGYRVTSTGSTAAVGPIAETDVLYSPGHLLDGEKVASAVSGMVALGETDAHSAGAPDVTVVTGSDFSIAAPRRAHKTTVTSRLSAHVLLARPAGAASAPAASGALALDGTAPLLQATPVLNPPTPASTPLPSYDPRACPG